MADSWQTRAFAKSYFPGRSLCIFLSFAPLVTFTWPLISQLLLLLRWWWCCAHDFKSPDVFSFKMGRQNFHLFITCSHISSSDNRTKWHLFNSTFEATSREHVVASHQAENTCGALQVTEGSFTPTHLLHTERGRIVFVPQTNAARVGQSYRNLVCVQPECIRKGPDELHCQCGKKALREKEISTVAPCNKTCVALTNGTKPWKLLVFLLSLWLQTPVSTCCSAQLVPPPSLKSRELHNTDADHLSTALINRLAC